MSTEITTLGLADLQEPQEQRPEDHLAGAIGLPPEQGASALRSARANDVPPVVARSGGLPEVRPLGLADLDAMPGVARTITSPEAAAAVKDDGEGLSRTQRAANSWRRGVIGVSQMPTAINVGAIAQLYANMQEAARLADEGAGEAMIRTRTGVMGWEFARKPADERRRQLLALQMQVEPQIAEGAQRLAIGEQRKGGFPAGPQVQEFMAQEGFTGSLAYLFRNPSLMLDVLPESAAQSVPSMALAPAGPVGVGAGSGVTGYAQGLLQGLQQAGVDTTSKDAIAAALNDPTKRQEILQGAAGYGAGIGIADLATAGLAEFVRPFGLAATSLRTRAPIRVETAADKAANAAVRVGVEGAGGAAGEVLASGGEATAQDVLLEFLGEAAVSGPMEAAGLRIGAMQESRAKAEEAKAVADYMDRVAKMATATKIASRDPKTLGDIVENMAADAGAPTTLYVTSEDLADALHQAKVSLNDFAAMMPEHSTAIIEGFLEGTAVPLPVGSLMQVAAQNPALNEALTQRVRPTEDGMSAAEATEFLQSTYNARVVEEADKILSGMSARSPMRASSEALRKRVEADLVAAGQSKEAAAKQSAMTAAFFTTAAHDMQDVHPGITPEEVFRKFYPDGVAMVSGPGAAVAAAEMNQTGLPEPVVEKGRHPFAGVTREQFLGKPKITTAANASDLRPLVLTTVRNAPAEQFAAGEGLTARYSEDGVAVYDGESVIASYNFGDTLVVDKKYRRQGIAEEMVYQWRTRNPQAKPATHRTKASQALQEKVWDRIQREIEAGADVVLNQAAYHGSPYRFSKFSLEHMGRGEGAQAYGWGLYFAGNREVADYYRSNLGAGAFQYDGKQVEGDSPLRIAVELLWSWNGDKEGALSDADGYENARKVKAEIKRLNFDKIKQGGQLYRVEIPSDDQYLLWDKPLSEQPDAVRVAIKSLDSNYFKALSEVEAGARPRDVAMKYGMNVMDIRLADGSGLYHQLSREMGSDEAASRHLNSLGIPGIKYLDGTSRDQGEGSYNYVIFDDAAINIVETYYQREGDVRGAYSMRTNLLRLTKANNASTFLHESGHQFLDLTVRMALMPNASPAIVKRADAILKWLGIEAEPGKARAEVYLDMDIETLRPYHEKFAESFEAYLFKGQAPSLDLAEAFRAFKTWLKSVYRNLQSFLRAYPDAKLDPEITSLMDRMLATDEQIAEAKASRAVIPLFDAKPESMTVEQWQSYLDDMRTLNEEAAEHIDEKRLADMQYLRRSAGKVLKQMQKDAAEKRAAARLEATRQVLSQPVYRLRQLLEAKPEPMPRKVEAKGLDAGVDSLAVAIAKLGGLNRDDAVAEWGIDPADFKALGKFGKPVLRANGGMSPGHLTEVLAEYGYLPTDKDGKADMNLLADRLDAEARGDKQYSWQADWSRIFADDFAPIPDIEENPFAGARLDRYWLESKYAGDERMQVLLPLLWGMATKTTGTGVNPDDLAPLFGYESGDEMVRALVESRPTQEAIDSLTDRLMIEWHGDIESPEALARLVDEAIMSRHRSRVLATELSIINAKAGKPSAILKAAKEAAGNIIDSVKVGALRPDKYKMAAARAGRDAMNAMARGNTDAAATAKQAQVLNVELFNDATREKTAVADFLKETRKWFGDDEKIAKSRTMDMVILARSILGRYGMTSEGRAEDAAASRARLAQYNPQVAADLADIEAGLPQGTDYTEMTVADVRAIRTVAEAVWNMARSDKTMTINGRKVQQEELAGEFIAALGSPVVADAAIGTKTALEKLQDWTVGAWAHLRRVQAWADQFGDVVKDILTRPINDAIAAHRGYVVGKTRAYRDAIERIKDRLDSTPIVAPELGRDKNGKPVTFAGGKIELLHAMLHTGNISNRDKLLMGRGWTDSKSTDDVISTARWDAFMARMYREGVITKAEWDFCQEVWDILDSMKPDAQKAHHAMFGYHFDEVTAVAVDTPFGTYRGGYVPAIADRSDPKAARQAEADDLLHAGNSFMFPTTGKGFTKRRVENYYKPLELDLRTITTHIDKVSRFIHIEPVVRDTVSFLKRDDVSTAIETSFPGFLNYGLNPWLQRVATQAATQGANPKAAKVIQFLSQRTGLQYIALSVLNALQGATGLTFAAVRSDINKGAIARSTANYYRQRPSTLQKIKTLSPFMANRLDGQQQEMRGHVERLLIGDNLYTRMNQFIVEHGYFMQNIVQQEVDAIVWLAAYDSAESRGSDNAVAEADEAVRLTQQTTAPEDIAAYEAGGTLWTLLVKFSGYFNMMLNAMTTEQQKALGLDGTKDKAKRLAYIYSVFFVTNVVAQAMVKGVPDDEDDDDQDGMLDEWLWWLLSANTSVMTAMIPGVGQGMSYVAARADDNPVNDRLTVSPTLAYLEKTGGGLVAAATVPFREEPATKKEVGEMLTLLSFATGIPTGQLNKAIGYTMDVEAGRQQPEGAGDYLTGLLSGKQW